MVRSAKQAWTKCKCLHKPTIKAEHFRFFKKQYYSSSCRIPLCKVLYCKVVKEKRKHRVRWLTSWGMDESQVDFKTSGKEREAHTAWAIYTAADGGCPVRWRILTGKNGHVSALGSQVHVTGMKWGEKKIHRFDLNKFCFRISPRSDKIQCMAKWLWKRVLSECTVVSYIPLYLTCVTVHLLANKSLRNSEHYIIIMKSWWEVKQPPEQPGEKKKKGRGREQP